MNGQLIAPLLLTIQADTGCCRFLAGSIAWYTVGREQEITVATAWTGVRVAEPRPAVSSGPAS
jgi:hypothetical protein